MRERGLGYKRITRAPGLPQGTIGSKYHRAKETIAECLKRSGIMV
jgi:DNA-directed RNA polymerase specialized sigma24 family protein